MLIKYKEPFWVRYSWEMDSNHENQYVTEFNKIENGLFCDIFHKPKYILTIEFKILKEHKNDKVSAIFGKPGMNLCLSYSKEMNAIAFEFWTNKSGENLFHYLHFKNVTATEIKNGLTLSIKRNNNEFILYKNFEYNNKLKFDGELIDDYKSTGIFLGCANPGSDVKEHRYYSEYDINHFSIMLNDNIENSKRIVKADNKNEIIKEDFYKDIVCLYDFKNTNNLGIVYDESSNSNFLEKVPIEFLKL